MSLPFTPHFAEGLRTIAQVDPPNMTPDWAELALYQGAGDTTLQNFACVALKVEPSSIFGLLPRQNLTSAEWHAEWDRWAPAYTDGSTVQPPVEAEPPPVIPEPPVPPYVPPGPPDSDAATLAASLDRVSQALHLLSIEVKGIAEGVRGLIGS